MSAPNPLSTSNVVPLPQDESPEVKEGTLSGRKVEKLQQAATYGAMGLGGTAGLAASMINWVGKRSTEPSKSSPAEIHTEETTVTLRGREFKKKQDIEKIGPLKRAARIGAGLGVGALGLGASLVTFGSQGFIGKKLANDLITSGTSGEVKKDAIYEVPKDKDGTPLDNPNVRKAGYNPLKNKDLLAYVKKHEDQVYKTDEGHHYLINKQDGCLILIPDGEYGDNSKICEIVLFDLDTNEAIQDSKRLYASARAYMSAYDKIKDSDYNFHVFDFQSKMVRGYKHDMVRDDKGALYAPETGLWSGHMIEIPDEAWKDITSFFDNNKTDNKQKLKGTTAHKNKVNNNNNNNKNNTNWKNSAPRSRSSSVDSNSNGVRIEEVEEEEEGKLEDKRSNKDFEYLFGKGEKSDLFKKKGSN